MSTSTSTEQQKKKTSSLDSTFPVFVPHRPELFYSADKFWEHTLAELKKDGNAEQKDVSMDDAEIANPAPTVADWEVLSSVGGDPEAVKDVEMKDSEAPSTETKATSAPKVDPKKASPFVSALLGTIPPSEGGIAPENMTLTTNDMPAYASTLVPTLDLFNDLQSDISAAKLNDLLTQSWQLDPLETLKIIFQCRSIHLGKGERENFYKSLGWLATSAGIKGKATLLANLEWVVQRTILKPKKKEKEPENNEIDLLGPSEEEKKKKEEEEAAKKAAEEEQENDPVFSHGYWKDLGNILLLEVQDSLSITANMHDILNPPKKENSKKKAGSSKKLSQEEKEKREEEKAARPPPPTAEEKLKLTKVARHAKEKERHERFLNKFNEQFYRLLHLATARAFAAQLHQDLEALKSGDAKRLKGITFAAKWAPSLEAQHDKHTFLASSIAEILFPPEHKLCADKFTDREGHLKLAREHYRRLYLSPLRAHLRVVERDITANSFDKINYQGVPSLAMTRYRKLFFKKDTTRFSSFLEQVALGKKSISGAVLTPSTLVSRASKLGGGHEESNIELKIERQIVDGQWKSLVKSIKERGSLKSAIAVVDVSGSMSYPTLNDGTTPMDSAIGLGMLLAEIAEEPFKNLMITFSQNPTLVRLDAPKDSSQNWDFTKKVKKAQGADWGMNTNFIAVFEKLLLPLAIKHNLKQEDMVEKIFVFSDMQFDAAQSGRGWETGFERLKRKYAEAGYELPTMVYWNLSSTGAIGKPVTGEKEGVVMMAGGGAGTLKAFLSDLSGDLEEEEEEKKEDEDDDEDMVELDENGEEKKRKAEEDDEDGKKKKKRQIDPVQAMRKLLANEAYSGLKIVG